MQLEPLKLPSGGLVRFKDTEDLTGGDYIQIQNNVTSDAVTTLNAGTYLLAHMLIESWEIPGKRLPVPSQKGDGRLSLGKLGWRDSRAILRALIPVVREIVFEDDESSDAGKDDAES